MAATLRESFYFTTTATIWNIDAVADQVAQTFTTSDAYSLTSVKMMNYISSYPTENVGDVILEIFAVDGSSKPTGSALATSTLAAADIQIGSPSRPADPDDADWTVFELTVPLDLDASTEYAITIRTTNAGGGRNMFVIKTNTTPLYADGVNWFTSDGGSVWQGPFSDSLFQTWGENTGTFIDASVDVSTEVDVDVEASLAGVVSASIAVSAEVDVDVTGTVKTVIQGTSQRSNRRVVAIGNNELWYEDI